VYWSDGRSSIYRRYAIAEEKMSIEAAAKLETFHNFDREILNCKVTSKWPRNLTQNDGQPAFGH
jgi:hypothetical protein